MPIEVTDQEYQALKLLGIGKLTNSVWVDKHQAARIIGKSTETLKKLRESGKLLAGIHYQHTSRTSIRYNAYLLQDWVANQHDPNSHLRAIENWQRSLPSNQRNFNKPK
ncbi:hypothetical protein [Pseudanabaena sp. PCC 6802]|uniref:hypothetical protein n=1 Tax=Pseudanabaena sp. PCC 6802 TaxID=118173 RepID=UPI00034972F7|nr:hypothetical protein [Pseudanabaena sp. PCC 6802]